MPKLIFRIANIEESAKIIWDFKEEIEKTKNWDFILIDLSKDLKKKFIGCRSFSKGIKNLLVKEIKSQYNRRKLIKLKQFLERGWRGLDKMFWKEIERITGFDWRYEKYECYVNNVAVGHYLIPNIIRVSEKNPYVIAEELFHLHYWDIWKKIFKIRKKYPMKLTFGKEKWSVWHISETVVEFVLVDNPNLRSFFKNIRREESYPWLPKLRKQLFPLWKNRKDFIDFIVKAHKICRISFKLF